MFKEESTEKLIEYIQTLPGEQQRLIAERIAKTGELAKKKNGSKSPKIKLSSLKGKVTKTSSQKIDWKLKSLRSSWERSI